MDGQRLGNFLFYPVMLGCVGISTYATFYGLQPTLGDLAVIGAGILFLCLVAALSVFHWRRANEVGGTAGPLTFFFLVMLLSTACNVNFFYTHHFERDLARKAYQGALEAFKLNINDAQKTLNQDESLTQILILKTYVETALNDLDVQIKSATEPGCGPKCREIMNRIRQKLPALVEPTPPGISKNDQLLNNWFRQYSQVVRNNVESKASEAEKEYLKLVADMETSYKTFENQIQGVEAPGSSKSLAIGAQELVESMHRKLIGYQAGVNKLLSSANKAWVPPRSIDPDAGRIGDIPRTFSSVFREGGSSAIFAVCVLLSLLIDSIPLLLSVLIVKRPEEEDDPYTLN